MALSKRIKEIKENIDSLKSYDIEEAIAILKTSSKVKFNESVDLSVNLGIDATKSDQGVRGSSTLPHGIGKSMKVVAFADGEDEKLAKDAGADIVGFEDLIDQVKKDKDLDADIVVATPDCMKKMGQLGRILGPKNLMPNPKEGTVTKNIGEASPIFFVTVPSLGLGMRFFGPNILPSCPIFFIQSGVATTMSASKSLSFLT